MTVGESRTGVEHAVVGAWEGVKDCLHPGVAGDEDGDGVLGLRDPRDSTVAVMDAATGVDVDEGGGHDGGIGIGVECVDILLICVTQSVLSKFDNGEV